MGQDVHRPAKARLMGLLAGGIAGLFGRSRPKAGRQDLRRIEFGYSTQRMGAGFTEALRDKFRHYWLRVGKNK